MFLLWEGVILSPSFLEHMKTSLHSNGSLPSNWVQDENFCFARDHIISGKINSSSSHVSDILKKCLYTLKTITGKKYLLNLHRDFVSQKLSNSIIYIFLGEKCHFFIIFYLDMWNFAECSLTVCKAETKSV